MKTTILLTLTFFVALSLCAQSKHQTVEVTSGAVLNDMVDNQLQYAFENFIDGVILHNNGEMSKVKMNYSYLLGEMQYIDPSSEDIMALKNSSDVTVISIKGRKFIPGMKNREFIELLDDKGDISLGVRRVSRSLPMGKKGAYGVSNMSSSVSSVSYYGTGVNNQAYEKLTVAEDVRFSLDNMYYLIDHGSNNKKIYVNNIKSYQKIYSKNKATLIEQFANESKIDFKNEADLIKLTNYCNDL